MSPPSSLLKTAPQLPVLLVCKPAVHRVEVDQLLGKARPVLNPAMPIMHISETTHPEVVQSFDFMSLPAFVLLQRGLELWRYTGPVDSP
jgi:hypothetical protein